MMFSEIRQWWDERKKVENLNQYPANLSTLRLDSLNNRDLRSLSEVERQFAKDGFTIIQGAVDHELIDNLLLDMSNEVLNKENSKLLFQEPGSGKSLPLRSLQEDAANGIRLVDLYVNLESARRVLLAPKIIDILKLLFREDAKLFQSLSFIYGSEQGLHQDTAYVVTNTTT